MLDQIFERDSIILKRLFGRDQALRASSVFALSSTAPSKHPSANIPEDYPRVRFFCAICIDHFVVDHNLIGVLQLFGDPGNAIFGMFTGNFFQLRVEMLIFLLVILLLILMIVPGVMSYIVMKKLTKKSSYASIRIGQIQKRRHKDD
jgi:phage shock protein PspC (stress-responsive transcriptional regulator)